MQRVSLDRMPEFIRGYPFFYNEHLYPEKGLGCVVIPIKHNLGAYPPYSFFDRYRLPIDYSKEISYYKYTLIQRAVVDFSRKYDCGRRVVFIGDDPMGGLCPLYLTMLLNFLKESHRNWDSVLYTRFDYEQIPDTIKEGFKYIIIDKINYNGFLYPIKTKYFIQFSNAEAKMYKRGQRVPGAGRFWFDGIPDIEETL